MDFGADGVPSPPVLSVVEMGQRQETVLVTIHHQMVENHVMEVTLTLSVAMLVHAQKVRKMTLATTFDKIDDLNQ